MGVCTDHRCSICSKFKPAKTSRPISYLNDGYWLLSIINTTMWMHKLASCIQTHHFHSSAKLCWFRHDNVFTHLDLASPRREIILCLKSMFNVFVFKMKSNVTSQLNQPIVSFIPNINSTWSSVQSWESLFTDFFLPHKCVLTPFWNPNAGMYCIGFSHLVTWSAWTVVVVLVYQDILSNAIRIIAGDEVRDEIDGSCVLVEVTWWRWELRNSVDLRQGCHSF